MNAKLVAVMATMSQTEQYHAMFVDTLTGVLNRRAFDMLAINRPWVALVDVDSLKWVNDTCGYRMGDHLLIRAAQCLLNQFGNDAVFRISGDEFVVYSNELKALAVGFTAARRVVPGLSVGLGCNLVAANAALCQNKALRLHWGQRARRGECPPWRI